uniref:Uncharacterized protein n=1 Tax=Ralstonia solanacearum TaxID=305 RepID=A0A0S4TPA5_RALSL|nr:protein of unknown function [Ralstonia solanacearum]
MAISRDHSLVSFSRLSPEASNSSVSAYQLCFRTYAEVFFQASARTTSSQRYSIRGANVSYFVLTRLMLSSRKRTIRLVQSAQGHSGVASTCGSLFWVAFFVQFVPEPIALRTVLVRLGLVSYGSAADAIS